MQLKVAPGTQTVPSMEYLKRDPSVPGMWWFWLKSLVSCQLFQIKNNIFISAWCLPSHRRQPAIPSLTCSARWILSCLQPHHRHERGPARGIFLLLQPVLHASGAIYKGAIAFCDNPARYDRRYGAETPLQILLHACSRQCRGECQEHWRWSVPPPSVFAPSSHEILFLPHFSAFCWLVGALSV